jgi:hypothetical protein
LPDAKFSTRKSVNNCIGVRMNCQSCDRCQRA